MNDFLTSLATRTAGLAEVIRPRLPSLFEPVFGLHAAPVFEPKRTREEALEEVTWKSETPEAVANDHISGLPARADSAAGPTPPQPKYEAGLKPAPVLQAPDPKGPIRPPPPLPGEIALDPETPHTFPRIQTPQSDSKSVVSIEPMIPEPLVAVVPSPSGTEVRNGIRPSIDPARASKAAGHSPARAVDAEKSFSIQESRSTRLTTPRIEPPNHPANLSPHVTRSVIEPRVRPPTGIARRSAPSSQSSPSEAVIQVTIGRIEVRATPQQPQANRERAASAVMSLDEYLRSREKRHRE